MVNLSETTSLCENFNFQNAPNYGTISSNESYEVKNMSAILFYYDINRGAILVSESRETRGFLFDDDKIKLYSNENIIIGQIGLNSKKIDNKEIKFGELIVNSLLEGKTIEEAVSQKIDGQILKDLIPVNQNINIFFATKNGKIGVYDICKDKELKNIATANCDLFKNIPNNLKDIYDSLYVYYFKNCFENNLEILQERMKNIMEVLLDIEKRKEKLHLGQSTIGGEVQIKTIFFE